MAESAATSTSPGAGGIIVWTPWVALVIVGGISLGALLVDEPESAETVRGLNPVFYPEPVARDGYTLSKTRLGSNEIPAYVLSLDEIPALPRPVIVLTHGGGITDVLEYKHPQYKGEWFIPLYDYVAYGFAEAGFLVIAIDAWWAGERYEPKHARLAQEDPIPNIFRAWVHTRKDVSNVIDAVITREDVDPDRIAVAGWSGGGITSLMAISHDARIAAAVAWKGAPDYATKIQLRGQGFLVNEETFNTPEFIDELNQEDAFFHFENIPPRAVALIGNLEDPAMPRQLAEQYVEKLRPYYVDHPDRLLLKLYETPRPTHDLSREALEAGRDWLVELFAEE